MSVTQNQSAPPPLEEPIAEELAKPRFRILADIAVSNGTATGMVNVLPSEGDTSIHRAAGNWFSPLTRGRLGKAVAAKLYPLPARTKGEKVNAFGRRQAATEAARAAV